MTTTTHRGEQPASAPLQASAAIRWALDSLTNNRVWQQDDYWINERAKHRRYSFRMLRYWYMERLLRETREQLGRPLRVLEIGVDRGQMKAFVDGAPSDANAGSLYSSWDAADVKPQTEALTRAGYGNCLALNLDDGDSLAEFVSRTRAQYDVIVLLHVLEHLTQPERAVTFLSGSLAGNGRMLGGFPVLPSGIARIRERQIRKTAQPFGHVSAFSPRRVRKMAERAGMLTDYAAGAFAVRASGSPLENSEWWLRANVAFGALFPGWPGEIYFQLRKPARPAGAPVFKDEVAAKYAAAD
ncbi:MAG: class I SAM-dependent methyltransferase [Nitrosomonadaceae bacterium]|jgi:hypothetical protein|nr:class I SAM-dependent methyltransferase [Nitrosomonadaceae bacterium]